MGFVVDASVCAKWFFPEEHRPIAIRHLRSGKIFGAPDLVRSELGDIVWKKCVRSESDLAEAEEAFDAFDALDIDLIPVADLSRDALEIAILLRHSFYDCLYLALAQRERVQFVTADGRLHRKIAATGYAGLTLWIADVP